MASTLNLSATEDGRYSLEGVMDFHTVEDTLSKSRKLIDFNGKIEIDLQGISDTNSAGLALLIEWKSIAKQKGGSVKFSNIPDGIHRLATVCDIESLLVE